MKQILNTLDSRLLLFGPFVLVGLYAVLNGNGDVLKLERYSNRCQKCVRKQWKYWSFRMCQGCWLTKREVIFESFLKRASFFEAAGVKISSSLIPNKYKQEV